MHHDNVTWKCHLRGNPSQPQSTFAIMKYHTSSGTAAPELSPRLSGCPLGSAGHPSASMHERTKVQGGLKSPAVLVSGQLLLLMDYTGHTFDLLALLF